MRAARGSIAVLAAFAIPIIIGFTGLGVDASYWMMQRRDLQTAADAAVLSAGWEAAKGNTGDLETAARQQAEENGWSETDAGDFEFSYDTVTNVVRVDLVQKADLFFSRYFISDVSVSASAEATIDEPGNDFCILALDDDAEGALSISGNVDVDMPDCGFAVNSTDEASLVLNGSYDIVIGDVHLAGGYTENGNGDFEYEALRTNARRLADPYSDLAIPSFTGCSANSMRSPQRYNRNSTLSAGVYCGGITVTGNNTINLNPGVYILDGGGLNISGNGAFNAPGVTIILTNSRHGASGTYGSFDISGGRDFFFSAPTSGSTAGVALYQDRNAPTSGTNTVTGNGDVEVDGAIYTPSQEINFGGGRDIGSDICTHIIGRTVRLHGNPYLGGSCEEDYDAEVGVVSVRLTK
jgi:hypothetical protein